MRVVYANRRSMLPLLLIALLSVAMVPATAQAQIDPVAPSPPVVSSTPAGPYAPAQSIDITVSGVEADYLVVWLCASADYSTSCRFLAFVDQADAGTWRIAVEAESRFRDSGGQFVDCRTAPCAFVVTEADENVVGATPQPIDETAPAPVVAVAIAPDTNMLVDRQRVSIAGQGFQPGRSVRIGRCAWPLCDDSLSYAFVAPDGSFQLDVFVQRIVGGVDCADAIGRCQLFVTAENLDYVGAVGLGFDPDVPPVDPPLLTIEPSTDLAHLQQVTVTGERFGPVEYLSLSVCTPDACNYVEPGLLSAAGDFSTSFEISRVVRGQDCVLVGCELVADSEFGQVRVPLDFDETLPPPPLPEVEILPTTGLVDQSVVTATLRNVDVDSYYSLRVCAAERSCTRLVDGQVPDSSGLLAVEFALRRFLSPDIDCAIAETCSVQVEVFGPTADVFLTVPIQFDPDAPLGPPASARAYPTSGLWEGDRVQLRGDGFLASEFVQVRQCAATIAVDDCVGIWYGNADSRGGIDAAVAVSAFTPVSDEVGQPPPVDCRVVACTLWVVANSAEFSFPVAFDSNASETAGYPAQLECVAWPTDEWSTGELPPGVDPAAVQAAIDQALAGGTKSIVVIYGGQLVAEGYDPGVDADTIHQSYSVSKSFTSTVVGLLVQEGYLELDAPAPVPEWSDPDDPRSEITLRDLLDMSSGLEWNESYSFAIDTDIIQMLFAPDAAAFVANKPLVYEPGSRWDYSTGTTQILARIIAQTVDLYGDDLLAELDERLFDVLGMDPFIGLDRSDVWLGGTRTDMSTREFAKLGLLYLRGGVWEDEQFLDRAWVDYARGPGVHGGSYSAQWWGAGPGRFRAVGLYGQGIHVAPDLDLVIAINSDSGSGGGNTAGLFDLFEAAAPARCNDDPILIDDAARVAALETVDLSVLANDPGGDAELRPATLSVATLPMGGSAEVIDGSIRYTAGAGFTGTDVFTYYVCTTAAYCAEAEVTVEVTPFDFRLTRPNRDVNRLRAGRTAVVEFRTAGLDDPVLAVQFTSQAIDCESGEAYGPIEDEQLRVQRLGNRGDRHRAWWRTDRDDAGCRVLRITMADGVDHEVRYEFR